MNERLDFVAIGDITTDAFIRLKDASVHCDVDRHNCQICMSFGDKVPYESVEVINAVGNSPNAAVAATRLGLRTALITHLGMDTNGDDCIQALKENKVDTRYVVRHREAKTNYHYVLWYEDDRTILIKHEEYPYRLPDELTNLPQGQGPRWLYLSSMGHGSTDYHDAIARFLIAHPETKLAFQPGTFQMQLGTKTLASLYQNTEIFICNVEESERILGNTGKKNDIKDLLKGIASLGPKTVLITDGHNGAYAYETSSGTMYSMPIYPDPRPPYERTGAGDAFASTFVSAIILGLPLEEALRWAPINSMSVVQYVGAQKGLLTKEQLLGFLAQAPSGYLPKKLV
jgi:sugar/nucleoside kinase (ribokinase family)